MYQSKKEKRTSYGSLSCWLLGGALCWIGSTAYVESFSSMEKTFRLFLYGIATKWSCRDWNRNGQSW